MPQARLKGLARASPGYRTFMPELILGPLLRYVGKTEATIWIEADAPCEVEILGRTARTFEIEGHHYALVVLEELEPHFSQEYEVALDGERRWPPAAYEFPPPVLRTIGNEEQIELVFGSCRVAAPHEPPYTLPKERDEDHARGFDALHALACSLIGSESASYPDLLFLCGDQVYADEVSERTLEFIRSRVGRPPHAPKDEVADFEEYTRLYRESWSDPVIRWLFSTVPTAMVIDDHDMHDDWNISEPWCDAMARMPWWRERLVSGLMAYWVYQYAGNLSPRELRDAELWQEVTAAEDAGAALREHMASDEHKSMGKRWSFCRDLGSARLVVMDSRIGRRLEPGKRQMVDDEEWRWTVERATEGDFTHLLFGTSDPYLLAPALHNVEAWSEKVCDGAWGRRAATWAERLRQKYDFDHWGAFERSFLRVTRLIEELGAGMHGPAPATIGVLSGDVHHAYLADVAFPRRSAVQSVVYQAVCSPYRNALDTHQRRMLRMATRRLPTEITLALAKAVGIEDPGIRWRLREGPYFDNQVATLKIDGPRVSLKLEKVPHDPEGRDERLEVGFDVRLN